VDWNLTLRGAERILIVLAGILCIYLGYLLFVKGVSGKASLRAEFDKTKLQLANAMPGVFFALFGVVLLVFTIRQNVTLDAVIPYTSRQIPQTGSPTMEPAEVAKRILENSGFRQVEVLKSTDPNMQDQIKKLREENSVIVHFSADGPHIVTADPNPVPLWPSADKAEREIEQIRNLLEKNGFKEVKILKPVDSNLQEAIKKLGDGRYVVVHMAGHGLAPQSESGRQEGEKHDPLPK
jgi:hypothetical protein